MSGVISGFESKPKNRLISRSGGEAGGSVFLGDDDRGQPVLMGQ